MNATPEEVVDMVRVISEALNVPVPPIMCNPRRKISCYKPLSKCIELEKSILGNPRLWSTVIHEVAHHVDFTRQPPGHRAGRRHHDRGFVKCLLECIDVMYISRDEYFWHTEYKSIRAMFPVYVFNSKQKHELRTAAAATKIMNVQLNGVPV